MQYLIPLLLVLSVHVFFAVGVAFANDSVERQNHDSVSVCPAVLCDAGLIIDRRGTVYASNSQSGEVFVVAPGDEPRLLASIEGRITAMGVDRRRSVFVAVEDGRVFRVRPEGRAKLVYRLDGVPVALNVDRDGGLVVMLDTGRIQWVPFGSLVNEE
ncbi:protein of unknown function [Pseudodesulfovibrio profundus]|uniref:NHL repeat containing protein n=1 Tax=Pseudodesulfovibrio profundus TaxID=57320 RepID=A0A2C8FAS7_9BACT|nr:hypothetical protein [Pseudodesulfovibrio profundus]SOB59878.1 protein of unknown function [Pseudodesulfovibrio profundus]